MKTKKKRIRLKQFRDTTALEKVPRQILEM
jgi:hypothetical protein